MKKPPFSFNEAKNICDEYQHIVGLSYSKDSTCTIDAIVIAPHNEACKNRFIMIYLLLNDAATALAKDYDGPQYDVMVISCLVPGTGLKHMSLHEWLITNDDTLELANAQREWANTA